jgi:hypothetical protein
MRLAVRWYLGSLCLGLVCQGCSYQGWYSGLQEQQRQECYKFMSQSDTQRCLDKVNSTTYNQYKVQREQALGKPN